MARETRHGKSDLELAMFHASIAAIRIINSNNKFTMEKMAESRSHLERELVDSYKSLWAEFERGSLSWKILLNAHELDPRISRAAKLAKIPVGQIEALLGNGLATVTIDSHGMESDVDGKEGYSFKFPWCLAACSPSVTNEGGNGRRH